MLKEQLLKEAQEIAVSVELDGIFEALNLTDEQQEAFKKVFESAVIKHSTTVAESHITTISESAEAKVEELVKEGVEAAESKLQEEYTKFVQTLGAQWLEENKVAIDRGIKVDLFESMFAGLKELVIEHNVVLPEESVDVVAEMEQELQEANDETTKLFEANVQLRKENEAMKREKVVAEKTAKLTESQREKVTSLLEGVAFDEGFAAKVEYMATMAEATTEEKEAITESLNTVEDDKEALNFKVEEVIKEETKQEENKAPVSSEMQSYLNAL